MTALATGTEIGKYALTGFIGQGGMGEVWQTRNTRQMAQAFSDWRNSM